MRMVELGTVEEIRIWSFCPKGSKFPEAVRTAIQVFLSGKRDSVRFVEDDFTIVGNLYACPPFRDGEAFETSCVASIEKVQLDNRRRRFGLLCKTRGGSLYLLRKDYQGESVLSFEW